MIDKRVVEGVLTEQKMELLHKSQMFRCRRKEEDLVNLNSNLAQVVIGVRRSGKSTLCFNVLHNSGVNYAYINFDDERLANVTSDDLNVLLEVLYKINKDFTHLFLDEAQNVEGWHLFVNRLLRQGMRIIITGSNAKLLSSELATHLTGRFNAIELYPFSFEEYCNYLDIDTKLITTKMEGIRRSAFDDYLMKGGFPELLIENDNKRYVSALVDNILKRDIQQRYNIRYFAAFEKMSNHLMNIAPAILSVSEITKLFGIRSSQTTNNYIKYLMQAYLLVGLSKYSTKSKLRVTEEKIYTIDVAIMDGRFQAFVGVNLGWRLETIIYLELLRRCSRNSLDIYYYKKSTRSKEVDFVVCKGNKIIQMYQVAYDISNPKTYKREIDALVAASKETFCTELYLITDSLRETININEDVKINVIPAYQWLLEN